MQMPDVLHPDIRRPIGRQFFQIRKTGAQAVAVENIGIKPGIFEKCIGYAARTGEPALMVQLDGIRGHVSQLVVWEFVLRRVNVARLGLDIRKVSVDGQRPLLVGAAQLRAINRACGVIEIIENDRAAKLAVVEEIPGELAERIQGDLPGRVICRERPASK